ncbi:bifunctional diaminohydroxyphosphoribosylaminopyrimidine deaminase/5-amino-6-(5-phosphoribosylamino)uracil reductase RibD, partial [bacterium]
MSNKTDIFYMKKALDLAKKGRGKVSPNPLVGAIMVTKEGQIVGQGWHEYFGGPHAELNAINNVEDKTLLKGATIYVTLEPCCHYAKTPPCAEAIINTQIKRVVIAMTDPNPAVNGSGIKILRENGLQVEVGVLEQE